MTIIKLYIIFFNIPLFMLCGDVVVVVVDTAFTTTMTTTKNIIIIIVIFIITIIYTSDKYITYLFL